LFVGALSLGLSVCLDCWREKLWKSEREKRYRKSTCRNGRCAEKGHVEMAYAQKKDTYKWKMHYRSEREIVERKDIQKREILQRKDM